ncbi:MAG: metallophosphoesterase [Clostridiaceae bacterium]|jgi:hypothetical protein|nr:metallophosphoesterase [Clostridiaceae bacterium]
MPDYSKIKPLKVTVITDIHYYSKLLGTEGEAYMKNEGRKQTLARETEEVIREAWDLICDDAEAQTVLIHGDITSNGDFASHDEVLVLLRELQARGKRIILSFSTHDYRQLTDDKLYAQSYDGDTVTQIPCYMQNDIVGRFDEFGRGDAISRCPTTFSYTAQLSDGIRLLVLDDDMWGTVGCGYLLEHLTWIKEQTEDAKAHNQFIFAMAHHPILPPHPLYSIMGKKNDIVLNYREVFQYFSDAGLNVFFTGHAHIHDISYDYSASGNIFYDISTAALIGYPPAMRTATIDPTNDVIHVATHIIQGCRYLDTEGLTLPLFIRRNFFGMIEDFIESGASGDIARFAQIADGMSIREHTIKKVKIFVKPVFKYLSKLTVKKIARWTKKETKLKKSEYADIAEARVVPFVIDIVTRMYAGDPNYGPDTAYYKIAMALVSVIDSIIRCLPIDFNKITGFSCLSEIVDPMIYNKGICDDHADIIVDNEKAAKIFPKIEAYTPPYTSKKGPKIIVVLVLTAIIFSPILVPAALILGIVLGLKKLFKPKKKKNTGMDNSR